MPGQMCVRSLRLESFHAQIGHANCASSRREGDEWKIETKGPDRTIVLMRERSYYHVEIDARARIACFCAEMAIGESRQGQDWMDGYSACECECANPRALFCPGRVGISMPITGSMPLECFLSPAAAETCSASGDDNSIFSDWLTRLTAISSQISPWVNIWHSGERGGKGDITFVTRNFRRAIRIFDL